MRSHFIRNFVTFEDVLECCDFELEVIRNTNHRQDFISLVRVAVNQPFAFQNFSDGFKLIIRCDGRSVSTLCQLLGLTIIMCALKTATYNPLNTHSCCWIAALSTAVRACRILAKGKLYSLRSIFNQKPGCSRTPSPFHNRVLSTDCIGRSMKDVGCGGTAS